MEALVQEKWVVGINYTLTVDDDVLDSTNPDGSDPLEYIHGIGQLIPGLERELSGMKVGDSRQVTVLPEDGYGEFDPELIVWLPQEDFPKEIPLQAGTQLQMEDEEGTVRVASIIDVDDERVQVDMNHPLAGQELHFEVSIASARPATEEELDHGHVHGAHSH